MARGNRPVIGFADSRLSAKRLLQGEPGEFETGADHAGDERVAGTRHGAGTNRATVISGRLVYNHGAFNAPDDETADPRA